MTRRGNIPLITGQTARSGRLRVLVSLLGSIIALILLFTINNSENFDVAKEVIKHAQASKSQITRAWAYPSVELMDETEVIWQIPANPKAVLFVAHGCGGSPRNFWPSCRGCVDCVGLPEESQITHDALLRHYAVIVIQSSEICWSYGQDGLRVKEIIKLWVEKYDLVKLPLVGLGASSGGYFLSVLATEVKFKGIVLMISSGLFDVMDDIQSDYPPTLFVHMPKDVNRWRKIDRHMKMLKEKGIQVEEIKCMEFPLKPDWLASKIPRLNRTISSKLLNLFHDKNFVDTNGYMKNDGRATPWLQVLKESNLTLPNGSMFVHHIQEEINLAYAYHEMTSLQSAQIFDWLKLRIA